MQSPTLHSLHMYLESLLFFSCFFVCEQTRHLLEGFLFFSVPGTHIGKCLSVNRAEFKFRSGLVRG